MFQLKPASNELPFWAAQYDCPAETHIETTIAPAPLSRGSMIPEERFALFRWKLPRIQSRRRLIDAGAGPSIAEPFQVKSEWLNIRGVAREFR